MKLCLICDYYGKFVRFMFTQVDGHSLAVFRILFGILMIIDLQDERAFSKADERWSDPDECRFPLFEWIKPMPGHYMCLLYFAMLLGAIGVTLGYKFRVASIVYMTIYWYIFLLDKSYWNNHSYLFGLVSIMLATSNANNCWSLDNLKKSPEKVPFWQYFIIRFQISLVYFLAGVKKCNTEWIGGHSMRYLSSHWVFWLFRPILSPDMVDLVVVHWGGFVIDSSVGILFCFDSTRPVGYFFCALFNLMNSQMFAIGMFPFVMLAVLPIYSSPDWPKAVLNWLCQEITLGKPEKLEEKSSKWSTISQSKVTREDADQKDADEGKKRIKERKKDSTKTGKQVSIKGERSSVKQRLTCLIIILYMILQVLLPFSHNLTQGYNTWTNGVYGYSWDMMLHNWKVLDKRIIVVDKNHGGRELYLNTDKWSPNNRWSHHADMAKQFVNCLGERLRENYNMDNIEIHLDIWISLNGRFAQRIFDPRVDILAAEWSPFKKPSWVLPILTEFTDWRSKLKEYEEQVRRTGNESTYVIFMADFPGLKLVNYIDPSFGNTTLQILKGWVRLEVEKGYVRIMQEGDESQLPPGKFHSVSVIKSFPGSYLYQFTNTTRAAAMVGPKEDLVNDEPKKEPRVIRFIKKWYRSYQIVVNSLVTITTQFVK